MVYAEEDFSPYDRSQKDDLAHGLEDVKVKFHNYDMKSESLVSILREMSQRLRERIIIPDPGDYRRQHRKLSALESVDATRTIWLVVDRAVIHRAEMRDVRYSYFICYDQEYVNDNPFHLFDENKPAWVDHTTIPHTLLGAMINITRPWNASHVIIGDPFVGSGTTVLEGMKYEDVSFNCSDIEPVTPLLLADNLAFFCLSQHELGELIRRLQAVVGQLPTFEQLSFVDLASTADADSDEAPTSEAREDVVRAYRWARRLVGELAPDQTYYFTGAQVDQLRRKSLFDRLLLYLALRTLRRNITGFERMSTSDGVPPALWVTAYRREASVLIEELRRLQRLRRRESKARRQRNSRGPMVVHQARYSRGCTLSTEWVGRFADADGDALIRVRDARELEPRSCDVIVTDPPYGFNTREDAHELARLYEAMATTLVGALHDKGHLVLCLPDQSKTGRHSPFFTHKEVIEHQLIVAAEKQGREMSVPQLALSGDPRYKELFSAPYYWESGALRRAILHYRIRDLHADVTASDSARRGPQLVEP